LLIAVKGLKLDTMQGIYGYLGRADAFTQLNSFLKNEAKETTEDKSLISNNELHTFEPQLNLTAPLRWGNLKLNTVNSGITFQSHLTEAPISKSMSPHISTIGELALTFVGQISNPTLLKHELRSRGHEFESECESEYLTRLIGEIQVNEELPLQQAVRVALRRTPGAYSIIVMSKDSPGTIVGGNTDEMELTIGLGANEFYIGTDAEILRGTTKKVIFLGSNKIASITSDATITIRTLLNEIIKPSVERLEWDFNKKQLVENRKHSLHSMALLLGHNVKNKEVSGFRSLSMFLMGSFFRFA
jgi:glucosamine--fructose-6-phosphate aminotransferase (isomerizing)